MKCTVLGAGSWGTALACQLRRVGHEVTLWAHDPKVAEAISSRGENPKYLAGQKLAEGLRATPELPASLQGAELVVLAVPSHVTRDVVGRALAAMPERALTVCVAKGIENDTLMLMSEVLEEVLPPERHPYLAYLSGPSFAKEVVLRLPTAVVVAATWKRVAQQVQVAFSGDRFRAYTSPDVPGVELGGALKNVIAIAAGLSDGMGFGHNARAGLITRGLAEMARLAERKGANPMTLAGLAGMGDLVLTCTGELSRNRTVGLQMGQGKTLQEVLAGMTQVAEGVRTARSVHDLAQKMQVDMPLSEAVYRVLHEGVPAPAAVMELMKRELKAEF
jgi:glycerol-3-phosphate dehydrogenase (NAD(P)+)